MSKIEGIFNELQDMAEFKGFGDAQSAAGYREHLEVELQTVLSEYLREFRDEFMCQNDYVGRILHHADISWDSEQEKNNSQSIDNLPF